LKKNAVAVIVNEDNKILLLKRADIKDIWMPNKWALVGGGIEKGETPQQAIKREIQEEIGIEVKKFTKSFSIQRNSDSVEHVFACRYDGDPTDIKLNEENSNYGWYDVEEMKFLDIVPHLMEYITLVFKKYE
jgi:8-oxo-dGTP diphosphatase